MTRVPSVLSVNVGRSKRLPDGSGISAIDKRPAPGRVGVQILGLDGDEHADPENHGGAQQAVYVYAREDVEMWAGRLGRTFQHGEFGENLTTSGIDVTGAVIGEIWRIGSALLQVSCARIPCWKFESWLGEAQWVKRFTAEARPGAHLRVLETGDIGAGDEIVVERRPDHGVTIGIAFRALTIEPELLPRLLDAPQLSPEHLARVRRRLAV